MFKSIFIIAAIAISFVLFESSHALKCHANTPAGSAEKSISYDAGSDPTFVCAYYQYTCTASDTTCTAGVTEDKYTHVAESTCETMKKSPSVYKNAYCCKTDNCNSAALMSEKFKSFASALTPSIVSALMVSVMVLLL